MEDKLLTYDEYMRIWYRPNTHDTSIVANERGAYRRRLGNMGSELLFDLGANIGAVSALAVDHLGYRKVVAVEPDPGNLLLLQKNVEDRNITVVPRAVVGSGGQDAVNIYSGGEERGAFSTTTPQNPRALKFKPHAVRTTTLRQLVAEYGSPAVVKCDIEGGEYALSDELVKLATIAPTVRRLVVEVHLAPGNDLRPLGRQFVNDILAAGWTMPIDFMPRRLVTDPDNWWADKKVTEALLTFNWRN